MTQQNIEFKAIPGQFNIDEAQGIVECFVAGIGNKDSVGDVLVSGAFSKSLQRRKPRVVWGHNWNDPIGKVLEIYEVSPGDRRLPFKMLNAGIGGLYAKVQFNLNSEKGREAFANVAFFGQEQEWSIGYKTLDSIFDPNIQANILKEVELYEVSPVLHGANQLTGTISVKSDESTMVDEEKGGMMMVGMGGNPMAGRPSGMMPHRHNKPTPNILEINKPGIGDERKNQLEIELAIRAGAPVKVRLAEENTVIFDRMTPDGAPTTYRVAYHFTGKEFMFGKPEKVSVQTVYVPSNEESGSRVVIPSQMPSMPMQVKPQGNAYMGDDQNEYGTIMPKSYDDNGEKWIFDDEISGLATVLSDTLDFKVGRTLSAKNMAKLKAILESLHDVVASADKEVQEKTDYVIPVPIEKAFETKQLLDPIFDYHRVESHVTEDGIVVTSGVTEDFMEAIGVAEKALGRSLGGGMGKLGRAARGAARFDPNAWDGDGDGIVQEGTPFQRPAIPGVNDRSTGGLVDVGAAVAAWEKASGKKRREQPAEWEMPRIEPNDKGQNVIDSQILLERMKGTSLEDAAKKFGLTKEKVRQREAREMNRLRELSVDQNEDILAYRTMGMSMEDASKLFDMPREDIRKIEMAQLKKLRENPDGDSILAYRERGLSLAQVAKMTGLKDTEVRQREQIALRSRPETPFQPDRPDMRGLASRGFGSGDEDSTYDEAFGPINPNRPRRGMQDDPVGDAVADAVDTQREIEGRTGIPRRSGLASRGGPTDEDYEAYEQDARTQRARDEQRGLNLDGPIGGPTDEDYEAWEQDARTQRARDDERGLASRSEITPRREVLKGEIVSGPGAVTPVTKEIDDYVNRGFLKEEHGELLKDILSEMTPESMDSEEAGKILGNIRKQIAQAVKDGKFDDFRDTKFPEDNLKNYLENVVLESVSNSLLETLNKTPNMRYDASKSNKQRRVAEELRDELVDEWSSSLLKNVNDVRKTRPPSPERIADAKKRARSELADLIDDLDEGVIDRDTADFWAKVDDILMLDPTIDTAEMIIDLERAAKSGKDTNPDNQNVVDIFDELDGYEANPQKLREFIRDELDDAKLDSEFLPERVSQRQTLSGGLASRMYGEPPTSPPDDPAWYRRWEDMSSEEALDYAKDKTWMLGDDKNAGNRLRQDEKFIEALVDNIDEILEEMKRDDRGVDIEDEIEALSKIANLKNRDEIKKEIQKLADKRIPANRKNDDANPLYPAMEVLAYFIADEKDGFKNDKYLNNLVESVIQDFTLDQMELDAYAERSEPRGLASANRIVRPTGIQRDERGNVDATDAIKMREERDKAIFTRLRDLGLSDEEIEALTGVPNGGREVSQEDLDELNRIIIEDTTEAIENGEINGLVSREEAEKILRQTDFIRGNPGMSGRRSRTGRPGLASQSKNNRDFDGFLRPTATQPDFNGGYSYDSDIMLDFLSGMSLKEIAERRNIDEYFLQKAIRREFARLDFNAATSANQDMDIVTYRGNGLGVKETASLLMMSPRELRKREKNIKKVLSRNLEDEDLLYLLKGMTPERVGEFLGIKPEKVRQMEVDARRKRYLRTGPGRRGGRDIEPRASGLASSSGKEGFNKIIKPDQRVINSAIRTLQDNKEYIEDRMMSGRNRNVFDGAWVDKTIENLKNGEMTYKDGLDIMDVLMDIVNDRIRKDPSARTATEGDVYQYQKLGRRLRKAMLNGLTDDDLETIRVEQGIAPRRSGLASSGGSSKNREMDMTLAEYAELDRVLKKYMDDSQLDGVGSDEDMKILQDIIDKLDDSRVANDSVPLTDTEIDDYIDTLTRMNEFGPVENGADKNQIQGLIDSLKKTKESADGSFESDALRQAGTRLSTRANAPIRTGGKVRAFRSSSGTINPHKKLEIELNEDEIGYLKDEIDMLLSSSESPNVLKAVKDKLDKSNNGKFTIEGSEYEDIIKSIEQSKSKGGVITSDLLGVIEQAAETNDGKYSSVNMRGGGLASRNGGRRPNNGAPPDITEAMQKDYIFWARSANARNLRLVQDALQDFEKNDGQLPPSTWRRLRTMYENLAPGSGRGGGGRRGMVGRNSGTGKRSRVGLASSGGDDAETARAVRPGAPVARGLGVIGGSTTEGTGKGSALGGGSDTKFDGLSLDEAKPSNWDQLTNEEKFDWLMYEGNPSKVSDPEKKMSQAAHEGAVKKVLQDMEREERRSMTPEQRREEDARLREEKRRDTSPAELERRSIENEKRRKEESQGPKAPKTYKPKSNAKDAKTERQDILQDYQDKISETERKLGDLDYEGDFNPSAEDIWETVYALLGDEDMTKKSINDAVEALADYVETNSPGENAYEKLSIKQAKSLLKQLEKTQDKYKNDPWIIDDMPRAAGLASRGNGRDRQQYGSQGFINKPKDNEMKKIIDLAQKVIDDMKSRQEADKGRRSRTGLASTSKPKAMITDEATFFKDVENSLRKEIQTAQRANNKKAVEGLSKLQEVIRRNEASKTGDRRTNVGSIYVTDIEADIIMEGLMFALDQQIEKGGEKRIGWYTKLLEKMAQAAMSTFIDKKF